MHSRFYNEAVFTLSVSPRTPLLIKAGGEGAAGLDPTVPDMNFVRTRGPDGGEVLFIPGASFRGVLRAHTERLLRSVQPRAACNPLDHRGEREEEEYDLRKACTFDDKSSDDKSSGPKAYREVCYACRLFGATGLASRVRVSDFYPQETPATDTRHGVAIDRVTGAAHNPFKFEIVTAGQFTGTLTLRNFTLGQFGLLAAALLDVADGLVPLGFGKSRGLGRVAVEVTDLTVRTLRDPESHLLGVGALCDEAVRQAFKVPAADRERLEVAGGRAGRVRGFYMLAATGDTAREWLEAAAPRWVEEIA